MRVSLTPGTREVQIFDLNFAERATGSSNFRLQRSEPSFGIGDQFRRNGLPHSQGWPFQAAGPVSRPEKTSYGSIPSSQPEKRGRFGGSRRQVITPRLSSIFRPPSRISAPPR
jgi:hypothetical protein